MTVLIFLEHRSTIMVVKVVRERHPSRLRRDQVVRKVITVAQKMVHHHRHHHDHHTEWTVTLTIVTWESTRMRVVMVVTVLMVSEHTDWR